MECRIGGRGIGKDSERQRTKVADTFHANKLARARERALHATYLPQRGCCKKGKDGEKERERGSCCRW